MIHSHTQMHSLLRVTVDRLINCRMLSISRWLMVTGTLLLAALALGERGLVHAAEFNCPSGDVACLITSIGTANTNGQTNIIRLANGTYTLTTINNTEDGPNGLPSITSTLQIIGTAAATTIIARDGNAPPFRIFHIASGANLTLDQVTVKGGGQPDSFISGVPSRGGGLFNKGTLTVTNSIISENSSELSPPTGGQGAGLYSTGTATINQCTVIQNVAGEGGGGIFNTGSLTITQSVITENESFNGSGGGIENSGQATINNTSITKNSCEFRCGINNSGTMTVNQSFVSSNADANISNFKTLTVTNSTVTDSDAGISTFPGNPSLTKIINTTVTDHNSAIGTGILGPNSDGKVEVENTIVADNFMECSGSQINSLGGNLVGDQALCSMNLVGSDEIGDPGFGTFQDNGTAGNGHFPLLATSKAVDGGNNAVCPSTDQLGKPRPVDGNNSGTANCDIGSFEFQVPTVGIVASLLPTSRSVQVNATATAFASIINAGTAPAIGCGISPITSIPATFSYQTTNPATNALTGTPNTPVTIPAGAVQTFVIALTPTGVMAPTDVQLSFFCANTAQAASNTGLNTLLFSASSTPIPDIIALVAVPTNDGTVHLPGASGGTGSTGVFAVASLNVGAAGTITANADTGGTNLPLTITLCQTNTATGACLNPPSTSVTVNIPGNTTPSFGVFVEGKGPVAFSPGVNRIFIRFKDQAGITRGATSVAVKTP